MRLAADLETILRDLASGGAGEVRENGGRLAPFAGLSWEVRGAPEKPLLHLWSEQCNLTRRVLAITDQSDSRLALAVERFGRARPDRLEFVRMDFQRSPLVLSREDFCQKLARILAERFPDEIVESLTISADLKHSLSGNYARGIARRGSVQWALLGVPWSSGKTGEAGGPVENSLTFALLWLDRARQLCRRGMVAGVRLILPKGSCAGVAYRCRALSSSVALELYELDPVREVLEQIDLASTTNLHTWMVPQHEVRSLVDVARSSINPIIALAPQAIRIHPSVPTRQVWLRHRGVAFARWEEDKVFFGLKEPRKKLVPETQNSFRRLVSDLEIHRHSQTTDTRHVLYRSQQERWLESIVREDVTRLDPNLDPRCVYGQVFANSGEQHGILDVLTVTRSGRLAILELKTSEHIHLPLQAAEYWLRIRQNMEQEEFSRHGYFPNVELQQTPPLVYLVAPALRFHPATDTLLRYLTPEMEVMRIGVAESWRRGIRVMMRQ